VIVAFAPKFLGQVMLSTAKPSWNPARLRLSQAGLQLGQADIEQAKGSLRLLVDSIDSSLSTLPEGSTKQDLSERFTGCKNLLSVARDIPSLNLAKTCLDLLREDIMRVPKPAAAPSTSVVQAGFLGIPTWLLIVGAAGAVGIGYLLSEDSKKIKLIKVDASKVKPVKVDARKDGTCRKGSRHMRDRTGCWSAKALD
jgi:hypothetical protein